MKVTGVTYAQVRAFRERGVESWLSPRELSQYHQLDAASVDDWFAGRVALKLAYCEYVGGCWNPASITIDNSVTGYPYIVATHGVFCSISHSSGWGVGAVSFGPVGVDVELTRSRDEALLSYVAHAEEIGLFEHDDADAIVTQVWAIKESAMKAWRKGLSIHPKCVSLRRVAASIFSVSCTTADLSLPTVTVRVDRVGDFVFAIASLGEGYETTGIRWVDVPGLSVAR